MITSELLLDHKNTIVNELLCDRMTLQFVKFQIEFWESRECYELCNALKESIEEFEIETAVQKLMKR